MTCAPLRERLSVLSSISNSRTILPAVNSHHPAPLHHHTPPPSHPSERPPSPRPPPPAPPPHPGKNPGLSRTPPPHPPPKGAGLDPNNPPVAHPVFEQWMRHQRIHPHLIRPEKCFPTARRQCHGTTTPHDIPRRRHPCIHRRQHRRIHNQRPNRLHPIHRHPRPSHSLCIVAP